MIRKIGTGSIRWRGHLRTMLPLKLHEDLCRSRLGRRVTNQDFQQLTTIAGNRCKWTELINAVNRMFVLVRYCAVIVLLRIPSICLSCSARAKLWIVLHIIDIATEMHSSGAQEH